MTVRREGWSSAGSRDRRATRSWWYTG